MKMLCESVGRAQLIDLYNGGQRVSGIRPSVIELTDFIRQRAAVNQLKFLGELQDDATDEEFAKYWQESDEDAALAVDSFMGAYGKERQTEKKPAPVKAQPQKPAKENKSEE